MKLFYITACDSEAYDLFVSADNETDARAYWAAYYEEEDMALRLMEVQLSGAPGPVGWHDSAAGGVVIEAGVSA